MVERLIVSKFVGRIGNRDIYDSNLFNICGVILDEIDSKFKTESYDETFTSDLIDKVNDCLLISYFMDELTLVDIMFLFLNDVYESNSLSDLEFLEYKLYIHNVYDK